MSPTMAPSSAGLRPKHGLKRGGLRPTSRWLPSHSSRSMAANVPSGAPSVATGAMGTGSQTANEVAAASSGRARAAVRRAAASASFVPCPFLRITNPVECGRRAPAPERATDMPFGSTARHECASWLRLHGMRRSGGLDSTGGSRRIPRTRWIAASRGVRSAVTGGSMRAVPWTGGRPRTRLEAGAWGVWRRRAVDEEARLRAARAGGPCRPRAACCPRRACGRGSRGACARWTARRRGWRRSPGGRGRPPAGRAPAARAG